MAVKETDKTQVSSAIVKDEFCDKSFVNPNASLPSLQVLRGSGDIPACFFVTVANLTKANWFDFEGFMDDIKEYTFELSGQVEQGLVLTSVRMLVQPKTPLLGMYRQTEENQSPLVGRWQQEFKEDPNITNAQIFHVMLLDGLNRPLHGMPFKMTLKGASQATFANHWKLFLQDIVACHAIQNRIPAFPKTDKFNSLCVFVPTFAAELAGEKKKSKAFKVTGYQKPEMSNWTSYFVGYEPETKNNTWEVLAPEEEQALPALYGENSIQAALPESNVPF